MRKAWLGLLLLIPMFGSTGMGAAYSAPPGLDVNDVSFLFPLKSQPDGSVALAPDLNLGDLGVFDARILSQVTDYLTREKNGQLKPIFVNQGLFFNLSKWKVVSVRYENCGDRFAHDGSQPSTLKKVGGCSERIRMVAQPFMDGIGPFDSALHLLFRLGDQPARVDAPIQGLMELKRLAQDLLGVETSGLPLMPHPALDAISARGASGKEYQSQFVSYLERWISKDRLEMVTIVAKVAGPGWKFLGGTIENGTWVPFNTPVMSTMGEPAPEEVRCDVNSAVCDVYPGVLDSGDFINLSPQIKKGGIENSRSTQLIAEAIDNPRKSNLFNVSCVSCHESKNFRNPKGILQGIANELNGLTTFVPGQYMLRGKVQVLNFAHGIDGAQIGGRTMMESAEVAYFINQLAGAKNPGIQCTPEKRNAAWDCLSQPGSAIKACLDLCR